MTVGIIAGVVIAIMAIIAFAQFTEDKEQPFVEYGDISWWR